VVEEAKTYARDHLGSRMCEVMSVLEDSLSQNNLQGSAHALGKTSVVKRKIRRARRADPLSICMGTTKEDLAVPEQLHLTKSGLAFLIKDIPGTQRLLVFAANQMLKVITKQIFLMSLI